MALHGARLRPELRVGSVLSAFALQSDVVRAAAKVMHDRTSSKPSSQRGLITFVCWISAAAPKSPTAVQKRSPRFAPSSCTSSTYTSAPGWGTLESWPLQRCAHTSPTLDWVICHALSMWGYWQLVAAHSRVMASLDQSCCPCVTPVGFQRIRQSCLQLVDFKTSEPLRCKVCYTYSPRPDEGQRSMPQLCKTATAIPALTAAAVVSAAHQA